LLALEGGNNGGLITVVDVSHEDTLRQLVAAVLTGKGSDCVFSSFEKGVGNVRSNCASSLSVFISVDTCMSLVGGFAYADNGNCFNGVLEADRLIFGVFGHLWSGCS
jgi:hypothetical protein